MNFQKLAKVDNADACLDIAFRAARTKKKPRIVKRSEKLRIIRTYEFENVRTVTASLSKILRRILSSFPDLKALPEFYKELIKVTLDYATLRKSLGAVSWAEKRIKSLQKDYSVKIKKAALLDRVIGLKKEFYGRASSVMKQIDKELRYLDKARGVMRRFPDIKPKFTIAIAGYPNVGKSSLLKKLTSANPEVREYAFTTKSLNLGYFRAGEMKVQVIDTPGVFDRDPAKMNQVERQAFLAIRHAADLVLFLIDVTGSSGYSENQQRKLLSRIRSINRNTVEAYSKSDLISGRREGMLYISAQTGEGLSSIAGLAKKHEPDRKDEYHKD